MWIKKVKYYDSHNDKKRDDMSNYNLCTNTYKVEVKKVVLIILSQL